MLLKPENTKGRLNMLDYYWTEDLPITNEEFSQAVFDICEKAISKTKLKIVHKNLTILPIEGYDSEIGSTLFFSLDSSHCSCHLYWKSRLMALDVFGCSDDTDHNNLINEIDDELKLLSGGKMIKTFLGTQKRFHFPVDE